MTKSELEIIYDTTSSLNKMCNINHDFSKTLVEEMKTLVKIITTMEKSELEVIYDATSTLNKMCNINHDFSKTLVEEMKTLVKIITTMEKRIQNLEAK